MTDYDTLDTCASPFYRLCDILIYGACFINRQQMSPIFFSYFDCLTVKQQDRIYEKWGKYLSMRHASIPITYIED